MELTPALADAGVPAFLVILPGIQRATAGELARCQERVTAGEGGRLGIYGLREGGGDRPGVGDGEGVRIGEGDRLGVEVAHRLREREGDRVGVG